MSEFRGDSPPSTVPGAPALTLSYDELADGELIGQGGNADVYRVSVDRDGGPVAVAVKQPRMQGTLHGETVDRFVAEAEVWADLDDHEGVVGVIDWGSEPLPWLAMEYMDGGSLGEYVADGALRPEQAAWAGATVCDAVHHAHRHGVAHHDIKPANVLLRETDGWPVPKVSDWGLARLLLEETGSIEGLSPQYAAPEQFSPDTHGSPDDITDIYQVGVLVYELFTGRPPFEGPAPTVMQGVLNEEPSPPSAVADLPEVVDDAVMPALRKRKPDRYDSVIYLRDALATLPEDGEPGTPSAFDGRGATTQASGTASPGDQESTGTTGSRSQDGPGVSDTPSSGGNGTGEGSASQAERRSLLKAGGAVVSIGGLGAIGWAVTGGELGSDAALDASGGSDAPAGTDTTTGTGDGTADDPDDGTPEGGGSQDLSGSISVSAGRTTGPVARAVAERFHNQHPEVQFDVRTEDPAARWSAFATGDSDIVTVGRSISPTEVEQCRENGFEPVEFFTMRDPVTVVVNTDNDWVDASSVRTLGEMWGAGSAPETWAAVESSWPDEPFQFFAPPTSSGITGYFAKAVADGGIRGDVQHTEDLSLIVQAVADEPRAIGYLPFRIYRDDPDPVKALAVSGGNGDPIRPSLNGGASGEYPLTRPLFCYANMTRLRQRARVREFVGFYVDQARRDFVGERGVVPSSSAMVEENRATLEAAVEGTYRYSE